MREEKKITHKIERAANVFSVFHSISIFAVGNFRFLVVT